jgi:hypothetical protein
MSFVGPPIRRLIVITLVYGLSAGMCCSPLAAALECNQLAVSHTSISALAANTFGVDRPAPRPVVRCGGGLLADRPELDSSDHLAAESDSPLDRLCDAAANAVHASQTAAFSTEPARTLLSLGVCWRV